MRTLILALPLAIAACNPAAITEAERRCAILDDELVRAEINAAAGGEDRVAEVRARRQQACAWLGIGSLLMAPPAE